MKIAFLGDIGFVGRYNNTSYDVRPSLSDLKEELEKYDYVVANLETPLTERNITLKCKAWHLKASTSNAKTLRWLGIDAVSLANNHMYDYGRGGVVDTINALSEEGISYFGIDDKSLEIKGKKIRLTGYNCYSTYGHNYNDNKKKKGINTLTLRKLEEDYNYNNSRDLLSCFVVHWGREHSHYPDQYHVKLAEQLLYKGNVMIIGSHPHYIQGMQFYRDKNSLCAYSLGNAIYDEVTSIDKKKKVPFLEENKKMILLGIDVEDKKLESVEEQCWYHSANGLIRTDFISEINVYNQILDEPIKWRKFLRKQSAEHKSYIDGLNIRRDIHWVINNLNYYSIGAKIRSKFITIKYKKEEKRF